MRQRTSTCTSHWSARVPNHAFERTRISVVGMRLTPVVCQRSRARRCVMQLNWRFHMRRLITFALLWSVVASPTYAQIPGLPIIDFQRYFPHITAVSEEARDREFPQGAQYKFLTVRDEQENVVWVAMTRREGEDRVVRLFLAKGPVENSEATLKSSVSKFS